MSHVARHPSSPRRRRASQKSNRAMTTAFDVTRAPWAHRAVAPPTHRAHTGHRARAHHRAAGAPVRAIRAIRDEFDADDGDADAMRRASASTVGSRRGAAPVRATRREMSSERAGEDAVGGGGRRRAPGGARGRASDGDVRDARSASSRRGAGSNAASSVARTRGAVRPQREASAVNRGDFDVLLTRGLILNKLVVTRTSGARLGVATQLWVDTDAWEVVALDVRQNAFVGVVDHVLLESLRQVGDVILVHDEGAVERRWSSYGYSTVVGKDVVTESGQFIGRVRDFEFDPEDGVIARLIVDAWGVPTVPEGVVSTYAVDVSEIIQCGQERVIVAEDAESRVEQLSVSVLQRLTLTAPPWEEEAYDDAYADENYYDRAPYARDEYAAYFDRRRERTGAPPPMQMEDDRRRRRQRQNAPPSDERRRGIPLVRSPEPYERRDIDGGYGEPSRRSFSDWVVREQRENMYEMADAYYDQPVRRASAARQPPRGASDARNAPPPRRRAPSSAPPPSSSPPPPQQQQQSPPGAAFDASEDML
jgi:sporulation protein YlmC with PRC-barrel domain